MSTRTLWRLLDGRLLALVDGWIEEDDVSSGMLLEGAEVSSCIPDEFHYSGRKTQPLPACKFCGGISSTTRSAEHPSLQKEARSSTPSWVRAFSILNQKIIGLLFDTRVQDGFTCHGGIIRWSHNMGSLGDIGPR